MVQMAEYFLWHNHQSQKRLGVALGDPNCGTNGLIFSVPQSLVLLESWLCLEFMAVAQLAKYFLCHNHQSQSII